ncbi:SIR2 family protein [Croceicoccus sp. Ery15]|uniref:SIR2 family protein n=1 Tax=Croceicoccus sp. Ery15 TaxID=1703338 RepID=UPI001E4F4CCB|nr:SIR2 family protein [Croceicoccus sp. Ery15]
MEQDTVILLGAGASVDAGIPDALSLTERVYERLSARLPNEARLFSYVIAKLITKRARQGGSPFNRVNIEEVYDALKRYVERENDPLNEFVYSWDDALPKAEFNRDRFEKVFTKAVQGLDIRLGRSASIDGSAVRDLSQMIENSLSEANSKPFLGNYLNALVDCLTDESADQEYLTQLVRIVERQCISLGSLNYDKLIENACMRSGFSFDYGLSSWNDRRIVRFDPSDVKLLKLHGSVNWFEHGDRITMSEKGAFKRGMIFGGQGDKLVHYGPYLQIRYEFNKHLRRAKKLGVIGYSFQDLHMNALTRFIHEAAAAKWMGLDLTLAA